MANVEIAPEAVAPQSVVDIRELSTVLEMQQASELLEMIWESRGSTAPVPVNMIRALIHAGHSVTGAFAARRLVGAAVAFRADRGQGVDLHSHVVGVAAEMRGRDVGFALKLHQREWALARGIQSMTWTFDPLIRRNAFFNIGKLGAKPVEYFPNFYGAMNDGINVGDESDRILVRWDLTRAPIRARRSGPSSLFDSEALRAQRYDIGLAVDEYGGPALGVCDAPIVLVRVPSDIEHLRRENPELSAAWRRSLRDVLGGLLSAGAEVTGFDRDGWYVVVRTR